MMIDQVIADSGPFFLLFFLQVVTFSCMYNILNVDTSQYIRLPKSIGSTLSTFRSSMGDFSMLDSNQSLDLYKVENGSRVYRESVNIVVFTFIIFMFAQFILLMIMMNFIIAVISGSYEKINSNKLSYDYIQRVKMVYEREVRFKEKDFRNNIYFPSLLVVQKKKVTDEKDTVPDLDRITSMYKD